MLRPRVVLPCPPPLQTAVAEAQGRHVQPLPASLGQGALVFRGGEDPTAGGAPSLDSRPSPRPLCVYFLNLVSLPVGPTMKNVTLNILLPAS